MAKKKTAFYKRRENIAEFKKWDKILMADGSYGTEWFDRAVPDRSRHIDRTQAIGGRKDGSTRIFSMDHPYDSGGADANDKALSSIHDGSGVDTACVRDYYDMLGRYRWYLLRNGRKYAPIADCSYTWKEKAKWFDCYTDTLKYSEVYARYVKKGGPSKSKIRRTIVALLENMLEDRSNWDE